MYEFLEDPMNWIAAGAGLLLGKAILLLWDWYWRRHTAR